MFFPSKTIQKSRSVLQDKSRSLGLFKKGKIGIVKKFHRTDLVICSHPREGKTPSYSQINTVNARSSFCKLLPKMYEYNRYSTDIFIKHIYVQFLLLSGKKN